MGQYANQPDFGTIAVAVTASNTINNTTNLNSSCLFIGTGGDVKVILSGVNGGGGTGRPTAAQAVVFKGLPAGSFLPVIVDYVLATGTTAADLIAVK
tara:strand:+ start:140 stop:430 length:291 start_codon:yes stop_codon:yes gene_type:complete